MGMSTHTTSPFSECLSWDFDAYNICDEEHVESDSEILSSLVRTSYLKHLHQSLSKNYNCWFEKNQDNDDFNGVDMKDIMSCANFLEHRALRACMIRSFYQRAMVKTMKEIKKSTEEGSLFSPLIEQIFDKKASSKSPTNKATEMYDKEVQTNISLISCKTNECPKSKKNHDRTVSTDDDSMINSNLIVINPRSESPPDIENNSEAIEDLFNILMHSPSTSDKGKKGPKKRKISDENMDESLELPDEFDTPITKCKKFQDSLLINPPGSVDKSQSGSPCKQKSNLDERLQSFAALFGEESPSPEENDTMSSTSEISPHLLPSDWKIEYAAQNCHLKIILSRLSSAKRLQLQNLFKELFASERTLHTRISSAEEALSRKRTANIVVGELTPHYIAGRIASRDVFKALAKKITDDFLKLPYVAGPGEISIKVQSYFENGRCIYSLRDVANLDDP